MISNISESHIVGMWQRLLGQRTELTTEEGKAIKIIYPGRVNNEQGADFRDAVIATSSGLIMGDIEVHVKSNEWQAHQHHRNPAYNQVILHVVMANSAPSHNLRKKALDLYRHYPKLAANTIERHMKKQLGISNDLVDSAQRQQGLIHIYHTLCTQGRCHCCPLSQLEPGNHIHV